MSNASSVGGDVASGVRSVFDRVAEFFHIFDLSFFVAGASSVGALSFLYLMMQKPRVFPFPPWVGVMALIIACYICGLIAFAVGRAMSGRWFRRRTLYQTLPRALDAHGLDEQNIAVYRNSKPPGLWWLYLRMWSEVAHDNTAPLVVRHLMRYWAMAAIYDAVAFSFLLWGFVFLAAQSTHVVPSPLSAQLGLSCAAASMAAAVFAFQRGAVYYEYQIEDVVAYFAVARNRLISDKPPHWPMPTNPSQPTGDLSGNG